MASKVLSLTACLLACSIISVQGITCPPDQDIAPCRCDAELGNVRCYEWFGVVTQDLLVRVMQRLREVNGVPEGQWLELNNFHVSKTPLTTIDLTPFLGVRFFGTLSFSFSLDLTNFGIPGISDGQPNIEAARLQIISNRLNDDAIKNLLTSPVISTRTLKRLFIGGNQVQGSLANDAEFITGLSSFKQLEEIDLQENGVNLRLFGGQFKTLESLRHLDLSLSGLSELAANSFLVESKQELQNEVLSIDMSGNLLKDENFNPANGQWYPNTRPGAIRLNSNDFEFISENNFKNYLYANNANQLEMHLNHFQCDQRMKWLKDARDELESRVHGILCENDVGKTIFTTNLV